MKHPVKIRTQWLVVFKTRMVLIKRKLRSQPQIHSDYFCRTFIGEEKGCKFVGHSFHDRNNIYGGFDTKEYRSG